MPRKVILITDPGIDGAVAVALALHDAELNVLGLAASAGNVRAEQATRNVQILVEQIDPPLWPRLGAALPIDYDTDGTSEPGDIERDPDGTPYLRGIWTNRNPDPDSNPTPTSAG